MNYLLDTDVMVDHLRGKNLITLKIFKKGAAISIITLGELLVGAYKSSDPENSLKKLKQNLSGLKLNIENLNEEIIDQFGRIKAKLETTGNRLEDFDLLIAATALTENLSLVTRNINHFKRIENLKLA